MKIKVYQWQYDDIEAAVWGMKDGRKWLDENLEIAKRTYVNATDLPYVYIFFGPANRIEDWKRFMGFGEYPRVDVIHAMAPDKFEGLLGIPVRVYDVAGDKTWYHQNYHDPVIQRTLNSMLQMETRISTVERIE